MYCRYWETARGWEGFPFASDFINPGFDDLLTPKSTELSTDNSMLQLMGSFYKELLLQIANQFDCLPKDPDTRCPRQVRVSGALYPLK